MKHVVFKNFITNRKAMGKKIDTFIIALLISATTFAQAPESMSYQAVVRDSGGNLVSNLPVGMQISILQESAAGTAVYVENHTESTNVNGLVTLEIGLGAATIGIFSDLDWALGPYFIKTETDPTGGSDYTITGTSQLLSMPYALYAKTSGSSTPGPIGPDGAQGLPGASAYDVYAANNVDPDLSEADWLLSLKGDTGADGEDNGIPLGGTEGQVLTINSSGVPEWTTIIAGTLFYEDTDGDGFGDINSTILANSAPNGYVSNNTDCNDNDVTINPDTIWYLDADGDGYAVATIAQCNSPGTGYTLSVLPETDCDDANALRNPNVIEVLGNGIDDNCDGQTDEVNIGQVRDGGVIFYVAPVPTDLDGDGVLDTGLVCAVEDQSAGIRWSNGSSVDTGATGTTIGAGAANTDAIIAVQGSVEINYAAGLARAYRGGGYADWFLPSKDELDQIYFNRAILESAPGFTPFADTPVTGVYWSSSETNNLSAWIRNFAVGIQVAPGKTGTFNVRAVRAF